MRCILLIAIACLPGSAQISGGIRGGVHGKAPVIAIQHGAAPRQSPQSHVARNQRAAGRYIGGGYGSGYYNQREIQIVETEAGAPTRQDRLQELVVSPTYQKDKISPKLIEIPN